MRKHLLSLGRAPHSMHGGRKQMSERRRIARRCGRRKEGTTPTLPPPSASCARPPSLWRPPRRSDIDHAESRLEQLREEEGEGQE